MRSIVTALLVLFLTTALHARVGLADWRHVTPGNSTIDNFSDYTLTLRNNRSVSGLKSWYFYKNCVIGDRIDTADRITYFVANEETFQVDTFPDESSFSAFLDGNDLHPAIWKRTYTGNWKFFDEQLILILIFTPYISVPVLVFFIFALIRSIRQEKFNFRKPFTIIVLSCLIFAAIWTLLDIFPQSF